MGKIIWDLDRLIASADGFDVARSIGMRINRCGSTTYVENVEGRKEDHIQHNQLFHDGCYDYSSGIGHSVYGMVKNYYANNVGISLSHDEICEKLAETCGGSDEYIIKRLGNTKAKKSNPFPLTKEELELIGLESKNKYNRVIVSYQDYKDDDHRDLCDDGYAKTKAVPPMNIFILYRENPEAFWDMVYSKTQETIINAKIGYKSFKNSKVQQGNDFDAYFRNACINEVCATYTAARALEEKINRLHPVTTKNISKAV